MAARPDPSTDQPTPSTSTPEYITFRKCYSTIIHYVKEQPGAFCDSLFANNLIPLTVRDYIRNRYYSDEEKAQKMADTLIDRIEQDPSVYNRFISIIEGDSPWADGFVELLKDCYETQRKKGEEDYSSDDSFHSAIGLDPCPIEKIFPHLNVSSLNESEKIDLEVQLSSDTRSIKAKFSDFSVAIRDSLESRIPLDKIKDSILSLDAFTDGIGVSVLDPQDAQKIESAESVSRVFMTLRNYISFFNYEIIERLICQYGTHKDKKLLEKYCEELSVFCQRNVYEIPPNTYSNHRPEAKELILKCTQHTLTLHDVRMIKEKTARILGIKYSALLLHTIKKGCVELHFLISSGVAGCLFPMSSSQHSALYEIGVNVYKEAIVSQSQEQNEAIKEQCSDPVYPGSSGSRDFLIISRDNIKTRIPNVVPRRTRGPLTEEERMKLEEQGIQRNYHHSDVSLVMARYELDKECNTRRKISGNTHEVKAQIIHSMKSSSKQGVILYYIGPGKQETGDWCFSDGFITFREIMDLYTQHFSGRVLTIVSDCSYSGSWVREAMEFMDEQGVGPCGHAAKEKGILVKVFTSCQKDEIPAELAFVTHGIRNDKNDGAVWFWSSLRCPSINEMQQPCVIDFTHIRCNETDQPCTMAPGSTWEKWNIQNRIVVMVNGKQSEKIQWSFLLLFDDSETIRSFCEINRGEHAEGFKCKINLSEYGEILKQGQGQDSLVKTLKWIDKHYSIDYAYQS